MNRQAAIDETQQSRLKPAYQVAQYFKQERRQAPKPPKGKKK